MPKPKNPSPLRLDLPRTRQPFTLLVATCAVALVPVVAWAAPPVIDLDTTPGGGFVITGQEHLPDFTILIEREDLSRAHDLTLDEQFLPKITEAVQNPPF